MSFGQSSKKPAPQDTRKKLPIDEDTLHELKEAFELFDTGRNGSIDARELKAAMKAFGIDARKDDVRTAMRTVGKDVADAVVFEEFVKIMAPKLGKRDSKEEIDKIFRLFDEDNTGKISFKNLKKIAQEIGENLTDQELYEMLEEADRDGDGLIGPDEFFRIMKRRNNPLDDIDSDEDF